MYATAKHKLPADSLGSSVALWPAVLAHKAVFLQPLMVLLKTQEEHPQYNCSMSLINRI